MFLQPNTFSCRAGDFKFSTIIIMISISPNYRITEDERCFGTETVNNRVQTEINVPTIVPILLSLLSKVLYSLSPAL